jgi:hypothetical protein
MSDDLQTLLPEREVTVRRAGAITGQEQAPETLTIAPFFFGQLPKAVKLIQPLAQALGAAQVLTIEGTTVRLSADWPLKLPQIVAEGGEALIDLIAFVTGKPRAWFDTLGIDDGIGLTRAVLEVNADFFAKRVAPMLPVAISQDGAQSGSDSSSSASSQAPSAA